MFFRRCEHQINPIEKSATGSDLDFMPGVVEFGRPPDQAASFRGVSSSRTALDQAKCPVSEPNGDGLETDDPDPDDPQAAEMEEERQALIQVFDPRGVLPIDLVNGIADQSQYSQYDDDQEDDNHDPQAPPQEFTQRRPRLGSIHCARLGGQSPRLKVYRKCTAAMRLAKVTTRRYGDKQADGQQQPPAR